MPQFIDDVSHPPIISENSFCFIKELISYLCVRFEIIWNFLRFCFELLFSTTTRQFQCLYSSVDAFIPFPFLYLY